MNGKKRKQEDRGEILISSIRSSEFCLNGVSEEFVRNHRKINLTLSNSVKDGTLDGYYLAFNRYADFCERNNVTSLPAHPEVIMTYFITIAEKGASENPVLQARSAIRFFSLLFRPDLPSPTDRHDVGLIVRSIKLRYSKPVKKVAAMTTDILRNMIDKVLDGEQFKTRNFSLPVSEWLVVVKSVIKFHCMARWEEAVELKKSSLNFLEDGDCIITFVKGKCNQFHDANQVTLAASGDKYCPVRILKTYLKVISFDSDHFLIPKISKGKVFLHQKAEYRYCLESFRKTLKKIGVTNFKEFGEHSDRVGALSLAANEGVSVDLLQVQGRWKSDSMPKLYHKRAKQMKRHISSLFNRV